MKEALSLYECLDFKWSNGFLLPIYFGATSTRIFGQTLEHREDKMSNNSVYYPLTSTLSSNLSYASTIFYYNI